MPSLAMETRRSKNLHCHWVFSLVLQYAKRIGATWAGNSNELPPVPLDAAIIFASNGALLVNALKAVKKGGCVICAGIYMSDIPSFQYNDLWLERRIESVANLTKQDGREFLTLAPQVHFP